MIILTAGNQKFAPWIKLHEKQAKELGYALQIYDLGGLGKGQPYIVKDLSFQKHGHYCTIEGNWQTRSLHKPEIVMDCLERHNQFCVYVDADAVIIKKFPEVVGDYDIGVTIRRKGELKKANPSHHWVMGQINAGVIFFNRTRRASKFIKRWHDLTHKLKNDQAALNQLINPKSKAMTPGMTYLVGDTRVMTFRTDTYNFYYFPEEPKSGTKILHFKGNKRDRKFLKPYVDNPDELMGLVKQPNPKITHHVRVRTVRKLRLGTRRLPTKQRGKKKK